MVRYEWMNAGDVLLRPWNLYLLVLQKRCRRQMQEGTKLWMQRASAVRHFGYLTCCEHVHNAKCACTTRAILQVLDEEYFPGKQSRDRQFTAQRSEQSAESLLSRLTSLFNEQSAWLHKLLLQ